MGIRAYVVTQKNKYTDYECFNNRMSEVKGDAATIAQQNGMYVIVQSGKAFNIVPPPDGFKAKEW